MTTTTPRNIIFIPARLASTRLPRKLLLQAGDRNVLQHTWERCCESELHTGVYVASGDDEILRYCDKHMIPRIWTGGKHSNGTSRVAEAVASVPIAATDHDRIVIVQGDEPEIDPATIDLLFNALADPMYASAVTLATPFTSEEEWRNRNRVKVALSATRRPRALYFSRAPIGSWTTTRRHLGVYAYDGAALREFAKQPAGGLETAENLEQLRHLQAGGLMEVVMVDHAHPGIDTAEDLEAFRRRVAERAGA